MPGLKNLGIEGFKVFKSKFEFELSGINILTGKNNSGKSSLIKILKLLNTCAKKNDFSTLFFDETDGQDSFGNQINNETENESKFIKVTVPFDFLKLTGNTYIEFWFSCETAHLKKNGVLSCINIFNSEGNTITSILKISNLWDSIEEEEETKARLAEDGNFPSTKFTILVNYRELNKILKIRHKVDGAPNDNPFSFNFDEGLLAAQSDYEFESRTFEAEFQKALEKPFFEHVDKIDLRLKNDYIDSTSEYMKFIIDDSYGLFDLEVKVDEALGLDNTARRILKENYESPLDFLKYFIESSQHQFESECKLPHFCTVKF